MVCIGSGPSLTPEDCELVRQAGHPVIVTNNTHELCPWASAVFAFDTQWWKVYRDKIAGFAGRKWAGTMLAQKYGAEPLQPWIPLFRNSGCCAISAAMGAGASRIILLGYDGGRFKNRAHWHPDHVGMSNCDTAPMWPRLFGLLAKRARRDGVEIINASRRTHLACFPVDRLERVL